MSTTGIATSSYTPMECLNVDFIGPLPDGGYILVIVDTFTRWVELFPTENATAASAAQALLQHFGRFGAPHQLCSDKGPHFIADLIREFLSLIGTQRCLTLAYSKQQNSMVERYNKEINRHIRAITYHNNSLTDYRFSIPFVQRTLNSNYSGRLIISAADMLFGKIVKLDRGIFEPLQNHPTRSDVPLFCIRDCLCTAKSPYSKRCAVVLYKRLFVQLTDVVNLCEEVLLPKL
jgi:transposase InsO family protein